MTKRPNVVFILTDDQGYGEIGAHGNPHIQTPSLDKLHGECVRFNDFHVGTTCAPTRSGLLTGHYCNSTGVWHTIGGRSLLREDEWTLANALREAGYHTGHFGKWHLGDAQPFRPHERGFETAIYHGGGAIGNTPDAWGNDYFDDTYHVNGVMTKFDGYCTDVFFREAIKFIEKNTQSTGPGNGDAPFFCYIAANAPHGPWNVENRYRDLYMDKAPHEDRARFYGMVTNIDENLGLLREKLAELGLTDNTILMFMTDNGSGGGVSAGDNGYVEEGPCNFNAGMRGTKGSEYEGGHRVPFFLYYPDGKATGGREISTLTSYVDFMPTILDLCGVAAPKGRSFHGLSLAPLIAGDTSEIWDKRAVFSDTQRVARPVRWRKSAVMQQKWRLVNGCELYNLAADPGQRNDVAAQHPDRVAALRAEYDRYWELVSPQFDRDIPFAIGESDETVTLTTHDIRNEEMKTAWLQSHVRSASFVSGYWEIDVRSAGTYEIDMRRWPRETGYELNAGIEGEDVPFRRDCIAERLWPKYIGGEAVELRWARIEIAGTVQQKELRAGDKGGVFKLELPKQQTRLFAAFHAVDRERTIAPFYIYIRKL